MWVELVSGRGTEHMGLRGAPTGLPGEYRILGYKGRSCSAKQCLLVGTRTRLGTGLVLSSWN